MNSNYLKQFTNENIEKWLLSKEHVPILEDIIDQQAKLCGVMDTLKKEKKLYFGKKPSRKKLFKLFELIKNDVDSFLEIESTIPCDVDYKRLFNKELAAEFAEIRNRNKIVHIPEYFKTDVGITTLSISIAMGATSNNELYVLLPATLLAGCMTLDYARPYIKKYIEFLREKTSHHISAYNFISIIKDNEIEVVCDSFHEYAHHKQQESFGEFLDYDYKHYSYFDEGHALGVETVLSTKYSEKYDNPAFLYTNQKRSLFYLDAAYKWMCKKLNININETIINSYDVKNDIKDALKSKEYPNKYCFGDTFFALNELKYGEKIYSDILKGKFNLG